MLPSVKALEVSVITRIAARAGARAGCGAAGVAGRACAKAVVAVHNTVAATRNRDTDCTFE
jgi:hypothetical protein